MGHVAQFLKESAAIALALDHTAIEALVTELAQARQRAGRVFVLGVGGSAANASHLVRDLRKLCGVEAYAPTDNVAELSARTNDEGWPTTFTGWLEVSRLGPLDLVLVLSVGGGDEARNISPNLVAGVMLAKRLGARVAGIVGRDGGYTLKMADACVVIPALTQERITPHTEAFQAIVAHLLVSHPSLQRQTAKWESEAGPAEGADR